MNMTMFNLDHHRYYYSELPYIVLEWGDIPLPDPPLCPTLRRGVATPQVTRPPTYNLTPRPHAYT